MEVWEVVGVDTDAVMRIQSENRTYKGVRWYLLGDAPAGYDKRYLGRVARDQFVSNERLERLGVHPMPGQIITLYFDRSGGICKVDVTGDAK